MFARQGWLPQVARFDGALHLELGAGADANHDPRTFRFPIAEAHLRAIRSDLTRHLLLWSAVLPLCDAAGTRGDLDQEAAVALLDPILLGHERDVRVLFARIPWDRRRLVAHGADVGKLEYGDLFGALRTAREASDWQRVRQYDADRDRSRRGVELAPLDEAVLRYTGQYLHRATRPGRRPEDVDPTLLSKVLAVVATAERASAELERSAAWRAGSGRPNVEGDVEPAAGPRRVGGPAGAPEARRRRGRDRELPDVLGGRRPGPIDALIAPRHRRATRPTGSQRPSRRPTIVLFWGSDGSARKLSEPTFALPGWSVIVMM